MWREKELLPPGKDQASTLAPLMASLSLLLIAFFIVFYSMAVIDEAKKRLAVSSVQVSFGRLPGGLEAEKELASGPLLLNDAVIEESAAELREKLAGYLKNRTRREDEIKVFAADRGLNIEFSHDLLFAAGDSRLRPEAETLFLRIAGLLRRMKEVRFDIVDQSEPGPASRPAGRELAALRAVQAARFLVDRGGLPAPVVRAFGQQGDKSGPPNLSLRLVGGVPLYDLDGKPRRIRVGDFTF